MRDKQVLMERGILLLFVMALLLRLGALMVSNPPEPYVPRGKITWEAPKESKEEPYTPVGEITWGSPVEEPPVAEGKSRGVRNNNPGNIRKSGDVWEGTAQEQADDEFVSFESPEMGIRAMAKVIGTYAEKYEANTIETIIARWAPPEENDTEAYIESVTKQTKMERDKKVSDAKLPSLIKAIIKHENGSVPYSDKVILEGIDRAKTSEYSDMRDGFYKDHDTGEKFQVKGGKRL